MKLADVSIAQVGYTLNEDKPNLTNIQYLYGEWVVYDDGHSGAEIGRVAEDCGTKARVCFTYGCTAALCEKSMLRPASALEVDSAAATPIGYYRFNTSCPGEIHECDDCVYGDNTYTDTWRSTYTSSSSADNTNA